MQPTTLVQTRPIPAQELEWMDREGTEMRCLSMGPKELTSGSKERQREDRRPMEQFNLFPFFFFPKGPPHNCKAQQEAYKRGDFWPRCWWFLKSAVKEVEDTYLWVKPKRAKHSRSHQHRVFVDHASTRSSECVCKGMEDNYPWLTASDRKRLHANYCVHHNFDILNCWQDLQDEELEFTTRRCGSLSAKQSGLQPAELLQPAMRSHAAQ
eukprot:1161080-Pelagomonas_calceolata.AAC.7